MYSDIQGSPDRRNMKQSPQKNQKEKKRKQTAEGRKLFISSERQSSIFMKQEQDDMKKEHLEYAESWNTVGNKIKIQ